MNVETNNQVGINEIIFLFQVEIETNQLQTSNQVTTLYAEHF